MTVELNMVWGGGGLDVKEIWDGDRGVWEWG